jgi:hypothetical protein
VTGAESIKGKKALRCLGLNVSDPSAMRHGNTEKHGFPLVTVRLCREQLPHPLHQTTSGEEGGKQLQLIKHTYSVNKTNNSF